MKTKVLFFVCCALLFGGTAVSQPASFYPRGIGGGGSLYFPSINPANDNEFYVSCDMSGLYHSTDFGSTYSLVDFTKLQVFGLSTYEFTNDPDVAYCNLNDGNYGYPVKTTDGGNTWSKIQTYNVDTYGKVYTLKANFANPAQLIIGGYGDILFSNDGGNTLSLVKHAADMGAGLITGGVFWDGSNIYIGTNEGIFYSTNSGSTFSKMAASGIASGHVIWSFAGAKTGSTTRFACIAANSGDTYNGINPWEYYGYAKGVYVMDAASMLWVPKSAGINFASDFVMYIGMAGNDISTIYLGGHDEALSAPLVIKSADGGNTWIKKFNTTNNSNIITGWEGYNGDKVWSWSESCFGITVAPTNSNKVLFGSYSNVEATSDGGESWRQAYVNSEDQHPAGASTPKNRSYRSIGLENTSCWQVHWQDSANMLGCFSDIGGINSLDAGKSWGFQYTGFSVNTLYRVEEGTNNVLYGACSGIHDMYQSTRLRDAQLDASDGSGKIVYSSDKGLTWSNLHVFNHPVYWLAIDPNNPDRMYASVIHFGGTQGAQAGGIYRTDNLSALGGSTWVKLSNPPRTEGHPSAIIVLNDGKVVCTFSGRINPSGVFTASSGVFIYDPAAGSWTDVSDAAMDYWTQDLIVDPSDAAQNTWYVCVYSGWGGAPNGLGGLFRTTNRGASWTKLTGSRFDRVTSVTFNPQVLTQAYLTTESQGLWMMNNLDTQNPVSTLVSSYPFRQPERVFYNPYDLNEVWVTSFGNGMRVGNMNSTGMADFAGKNSDNVVVYPNPNDGNCMVRMEMKQSSDAVIRVTDMTGRTIFSQNILLRSGDNMIPLSIKSISKGIYSLQVTTFTEGVRSSMLLIQ